MYRAPFQLPRKALWSVSVAASGAALHERDKLSVYSSPTPDILLQETPSDLEKQIGIARRRVTEAVNDGHGRVQNLVSKWIGVEHAIENRVKSIISPSEPLTPGILYVGIAGLSGSIIARNRSLPTRFLLPPVLLVASAKHFLPQTTSNLSDYLASLEETYFPTLAQKHDIATAHTRMTLDRIKEAAQDSRAWARRGAENAVETVQEYTGLKVGEALGWAKQERVKVEEKTREVLANAESKGAELEEKAKDSVKRVEELVKASSTDVAKSEPTKRPEEVKRVV